MDLRIDFASLTDAAGQLQRILDTAERSSALAQGTTLDATYSGMPELSALGAAHGAVLAGNAGSALTVLKNFAEQLDWGRYNLQRNHDLFENHELGFAQAFTHGDVGGAVHTIKTLATARPDGGVGNFNFPTPTITPHTSLTDVITQLTSTNTSQATQASASWRTMATEATTIAAQLTTTAAHLAAHNDGAAVDAACQVITDMADVATQFSANATHMADTVTYLATIPAAFTPSLVAMKTATDIIQDPVEKSAAEKLALTHFYSVYGPAIQAAIPATRNLTQPLPGGGGGGGAAAGMAETARSDLPTVHQLHQRMAPGVEQLHHHYHPDSPHWSGTETHGSPHQGQPGLADKNYGPTGDPGGYGHHGGGMPPRYPTPPHAPTTLGDAGHLATERAAYAPPAELAGGNSHMTQATNLPGGGPHRPTPGVGTPHGLGGPGGLGGRPMPAIPGGGIGGLPGGLGKLGAPGASGSFGGLGPTTPRGIGGGTSPKGVSSNFRGSLGQVGGVGSAGTDATTGGRAAPTGGTSLLGGIPPGGVSSRGSGKRRNATGGNSVKGVLHHMAQTHNQDDLLGPRPATIPGVIGEWVRKEPQERTGADYRC